MKTFYQVLGVAEKASQAEIKKAFVSAIRDLHPDKVAQAGGKGDEHLQKSQEVNEAFTTLKDPDKRAEYDRYELPKVKAQQQAEGNENQSFDIPSSPSMEKNESQDKEESKTPAPKPDDKKNNKDDKDDEEEEDEKKKKGGEQKKTPNIFRDFEGGVKKADAFVSKIFASPEMEKRGSADKDKDKDKLSKDKASEKEHKEDLPYKRFGLGN